MALLQIHEPGQTPLPHQDEQAIGIDLGTTNSVVAVARDGEVKVLRDADGVAMVPSVVYYGDIVTVGANARQKLHAGDALAVGSIKRLMGAGHERAAELSFSKTTTTEGMAQLDIGGVSRNPVEISADILRHLRQRAEEALGEAVHKAVITVPAYFDDAARAATKDAAKLAGIEVLRLVNEPTAAALAYGLDNEAEGIYAIYDLGGGTFDISLLKLQTGVFQVLATGGDAQLGGDDFDHLIAKHFCDKAGVRPKDSAAFHPWLAIGRAAKEALTEQDSWQGELEGKSLSLTRKEVDAMLAPLVHKTIDACHQVLSDAQVSPDEVKGVVLVGGSTRMPLVRKEVEAFFEQSPLTNVNPDEVVAVGAALQADGLSRGSSNLLLDVIPLSLGMETMGGIVEKVIYRNTPIPVSIAQEFTTYQDGQTGMQIHVVQGERELVDQCRSLARFELVGIPPMVAGAARVQVNFTVDADGLLTVTAREQTTGEVQSVEVKPSYGLPESQIERMLRDSMEHARHDMELRLLTEARVEAERNIFALESALKKDGHLLAKAEKDSILKQVALLRDAVQGEDRDVISAEADNMEKAVQSFAAKRMEAGVGAALKGHDIADVEEIILKEGHV